MTTPVEDALGATLRSVANLIPGNFNGVPAAIEAGRLNTVEAPSVIATTCADRYGADIDALKDTRSRVDSRGTVR